ncbi:MAG: hypothetical protein ACI9LO_000003 [Planctomycetota bacterium]|jgi:hypothetical protein
MFLATRVRPEKLTRDANTPMDKSQTFDWQVSLASTFNEFLTEFIAFSPRVAGALALLLAGWAIAFVLRLATWKLIHGFDYFFRNAVKNQVPNSKK